ncbi:hypothetical protein [Nocardia harenae]|uniref:hypothetical protein n=1 Tax=Nocardia harenae TaxID=358707 RepID=UPI000ABDB330|nr:hypothetical protein [Nocardia harenae]
MFRSEPGEHISGLGIGFDAPAKCPVPQLGWGVGDVDRTEVGARRHDFVDAVQEVVTEAGLAAREEIIELVEGAWADDRLSASSARWMIRVHSSWSGLPRRPSFTVPRVYGLTRMPVRPSGRVCTECSCCAGLDGRIR